ncbi:MAG: DUF59 domain-containing protein [Pelagibacteraceae bacterium]|jgi:FeS assembly SUF system protein|nr:DUF59 domain-containing protein [Pelagibacteraceae bacterium]HJO13638.1 iron-sulfur cluster assembly protein [Alphaproteobacteria bacterium]MBO6465964.1 DUF59 domain-containing protein [Pelagibacteraceae bacterium]MBO6467326.1 DUF59 domain-containing protein [Pelagibacteraceae bacterium]MBO6470369.1 DUF59 domain-containing protein [Pelagibacteraceae bacterium]|tara:strand:- start:766 stop:1155 length:390 start_codon:yes stop_codon:yes gene_type:complete
MTEEKKIDDFLYHKNTSFYKEFKEKKISQQIPKNHIIEKIKTVMDPEIPVNLYDLGLIYNINVDEKNNIIIEMTLTNPNCPVADSLPESVGNAISSLVNISSIKIILVWHPKWSKKMMSEDAKLALDVF